MARFANAVDVMGVWSEKPLSEDELVSLRALSVLPGTKVCVNEDEQSVDLWTLGALSACERFRLFVTAFVSAEEKACVVEPNEFVRNGQKAMIETCKTLL